MTDNDIIEMIVSQCAAGKPFSINQLRGGEWVKIIDFPIDAIKIVRERAIKEFAERLAEKYADLYGYRDGLLECEIDNLVKEMTEGEDGNV